MGKESTSNAGATGVTGSIPRLGRSPGEGNGDPLQYSSLENPMDSEPGRKQPFLRWMPDGLESFEEPLHMTAGNPTARHTEMKIMEHLIQE